MYLQINKKSLWIIFLAFIILIGWIVFKLSLKPRSFPTDSSSKSYIALVIDDLGGCGREGIDELMKLDIPITAAVMPFLEYTESDVESCYNAGLEIILHLSMEPEQGSINWLSPRPITCNKANEEVRQIVEDGLKELKYAKGMNNHMSYFFCSRRSSS